MNNTRIMKLSSEDHPMLSQVLEDFDFKDTELDPVEITNVLFDNMTHYNGLGISANQLGLPFRVFVMRGTPSVVCFNPRIVDVSTEEILLEEGCLTYPDLFVKVKRPVHIKVRFQDPLGETHTEKYTGMTARIFQHELDHMNGVFCFSRATKFHFDTAKKNRHLLRRKKKRYAKQMKKQPMINTMPSEFIYNTPSATEGDIFNYETTQENPV